MKKPKNNGQGYQPKTGAKCGCRAGQQRDNCPQCEGTGYKIDFAAIRAKYQAKQAEKPNNPTL